MFHYSGGKETLGAGGTRQYLKSLENNRVEIGKRRKGGKNKKGEEKLR
jgi:hypothetical protein